MDESEDSEDDIPLSSLMKYKKRRKVGDWIRQDITDTLPTWRDECTSKGNLSPLDLFYLFF